MRREKLKTSKWPSTGSAGMEAYAAAVLGAAVLVTVLLAQVTAAQGQETFEDRTDVLEVEVPVNVVSRDGEPIRELDVTSFEVFDNGKRQEITGFRKIELDILGQQIDQHEITQAVPAAARRRILMLFDTTFSTPISLAKARTAARDFVVDSLHPSDLVAVAVHSIERGPHLLVTFTPDRAQVARALDMLAMPELLYARNHRDPLRFIIDPVMDPGLRGSSLSSGTEGPQLEQDIIDHLSVVGERMARIERSFERSRITSWSRGLGEMAGYLKNVKGRKHVVLFSEGFDGRLMLGQTRSLDNSDDLQYQTLQEAGEVWRIDTDELYGNAGLQGDIRDMIEEFRRADCVIQAVDVSGLTAEIAEDERNRSIGQDALFFIANETGGDLFEDANNFGFQLARVMERSSVTYLLSFQPTKVSFDGSYHHLKVKGPRGTRLSHRKGYYEPTTYATLHPLEKSLLAGDAIAAADERRDVELNVIAVPFRTGGERSYVPVLLEIDGPTLTADNSGDLLDLEIYAYVTDDKGNMPDYFSRFLYVDLSKDGGLVSQGGIKYYGHVSLGPGDYMIRVLARNGQTGATGVETRPLKVPDFAEGAGLAVLPPLFFEEPGRWLMVREERDPASRGDSVVYPFTVNGEPFVPAALPSLDPRRKAELCLVAYNMSGDQIEVESKVLTSEGTEVDDGRVTLVERTVTGIEGVDKLLATFRPQNLETGRYTLSLELTDSASGATQTQTIPFRID